MQHPHGENETLLASEAVKMGLAPPPATHPREKGGTPVYHRRRKSEKPRGVCSTQEQGTEQNRISLVNRFKLFFTLIVSIV